MRELSRNENYEPYDYGDEHYINRWYFAEFDFYNEEAECEIPSEKYCYFSIENADHLLEIQISQDIENFSLLYKGYK